MKIALGVTYEVHQHYTLSPISFLDCAQQRERRKELHVIKGRSPVMHHGTPIINDLYTDSCQAGTVNTQGDVWRILVIEEFGGRYRLDAPDDGKCMHDAMAK